MDDKLEVIITVDDVESDAMDELTDGKGDDEDE